MAIFMFLCWVFVMWKMVHVGPQETAKLFIEMDWCLKLEIGWRGNNRNIVAAAFYTQEVPTPEATDCNSEKPPECTAERVSSVIF